MHRSTEGMPRSTWYIACRKVLRRHEAAQTRPESAPVVLGGKVGADGQERGALAAAEVQGAPHLHVQLRLVPPAAVPLRPA